MRHGFTTFKNNLQENRSAKQVVCADGQGRRQSGTAWALGAWEDRLPMPESPVTSPAPRPLPAGRTGSLPHASQTCPRRSTLPSRTSPSGGRSGYALPMVTLALCTSSEIPAFRELRPGGVRGMGCVQTPTYKDHTENNNLSFV